MNKSTKPDPIDNEPLDDDFLENEESEEEEEDDYEPQIDPDEEEFEEDENEYFIKTKDNKCIKNNYCSRCEGTPHDPEGYCSCRCHDIA